MEDKRRSDRPTNSIWKPCPLEIGKKIHKNLTRDLNDVFSLAFRLIHLLFNKTSSEMVSVEGFLPRSHSKGSETGRKNRDMPNYTWTGLKMSGNRSDGVMNLLRHKIVLCNVYTAGQETSTTQTVYKIWWRLCKVFGCISASVKPEISFWYTHF